MKSPSEFERGFFRLLKLVNGTLERPIQDLAENLDYPVEDAQEMIVEWASDGLINLEVYNPDSRRWESWRRYEPLNRVFSINSGSIQITLRAAGEERCRVLAKGPIGFTAPG